MALAALVMAGGKATRMGSAAEKPLLHVGDKPLIQLVVEALKQSRSIDRIIVAVSPRTQRTAETARALSVDVAETAGVGYEPDMKEAIKTLGLGDVAVVSADLPFLTPRIVDEAVDKYLLSGKPALMVAAPVKLYRTYGMEPLYVFDLDGQELAPVGLNIINGRRIDEPKLDETIFVVEADDLVFNVNTPSDLEIARSRANRA